MDKQGHILEVMVRLLRGEKIMVKELFNQYAVSRKSIYRDINEIKNFVLEHRELMGNGQFVYSTKDASYVFEVTTLLQSKELFAIIKILIGSRAIKKAQLKV